MNKSENIGQLVAALVKAQTQFAPIKKDKVGKIKGTNPSGRSYEYEYRYADLAAIVAATYPALNANGLVIMQGTAGSTLWTLLAHESGEWIKATYDLPTGLTPQKMGSAITYGRRYSHAIIGVVADDDDDGAVAENGGGMHTPPPDNHEPAEWSLEDGAVQVADRLIDSDRELCKTWKSDCTRKNLIEFITKLASDKRHDFIDKLEPRNLRELYEHAIEAINGEIDAPGFEDEGLPLE